MSARPWIPDDLFDDLPFFSTPAEKATTIRELARPADPRNQAAAQQVATLTDRRVNDEPRRNFQLAPAAIAKAKREMDEMSDQGVWTSARGVHLVALYSWLHTAVYGVEPAELDGKAWALASVMAGRFCTANFQNDFGECVEFMRWVWKRETGREEWRRSHRQGGQRIGWRLQFAPSLVTDYRIDQARRAAT